MRYGMWVVAMAVGCKVTPMGEVPQPDGSSPLALDEDSALGFSGDDVLAVLGARSYVVATEDSPFGAHGVLSASFDADAVTAADVVWLEPDAEAYLELDGDLHVVSADGGLDVTVAASVHARSLDEGGVAWAGLGSDRHLTGQTPAWLDDAVGDAARAQCAALATALQGQLSLTGDLSGPTLTLTSAWRDVERCPSQGVTVVERVDLAVP